VTGRHVASQPSLAPTRKVTAVFGGGAAATLLIFATRRIVGYDLDPELAGLIITAAVTAAGYATREYAQAQATASRARHAPRPPADDAGITTVEILLLIIVVMLFILVAVTTGVRIDV
jgi:uncharacterized membrane protein YidH (DUF202 family)